MAIFLIIAGAVSLIYGLMSVAGFTKNNISKDSDLDKKVLSESSRYFIGRYFAGGQFVIAGLGAIAFGLILYLS